MTICELSLNAMREIKSRRDELATQHDKTIKNEDRVLKESQRASGIHAFMKWFGIQRKNQGIVMSSDNMLDVQKSLHHYFKIGLHDMRYFIAIPQECCVWFQDMPWLHVAIGRNSSFLSLVCERTRIPDVNLPEFALNFEIECDGLIKMMTNYHYLDVRIFTGVPTTDQSEYQKISVSKDVFMTLDIRVIGGDRSFQSLLDGRNPNGFVNRSITTAKAPSPLLKPLDIDPPTTPLLSSGKAR